MATLDTRTFDITDSLSEQAVLEEWKFVTDQVKPAIEKVNGVRSVKLYSGAGALRADITVFIDMEDAAAYERLLFDPQVRKLLGRTYGAWNLNTAGQSFRREVIPELIRALSSTG